MSVAPDLRRIYGLCISWYVWHVTMLVLSPTLLTFQHCTSFGPFSARDVAEPSRLVHLVPWSHFGRDKLVEVVRVACRAFECRFAVNVA